MLFNQKPEDFNQKYDVVGCLCEYNGKILLMLRHKEETQGNTWGLPSGRVEPGEDLKEALKRELYEETGIDVSHEKFEYIDKSYLRHSDADLTYHLFALKLEEEVEIKLDPNEHQKYVWISPEEACELEDRIEDLECSIKLYYK